MGVCNHGCHWTTYFSSLGELVNPLQSNVHVAAHSYSMYQKASRVVSAKPTSTSHLNRTCPLPLHQAAAVILHKQYCSYYRNTLLPCTTFAQQIPMLMSQLRIHLATYGYSMSQEVDGSCHSNSLPLQTKSKTCSASSSSNCRHTSQAGRHCCHVALHFITTASTRHVATAQRTCRQVQSV